LVSYWKKKFLRRPYFRMNHCLFLTEKGAIFCVRYSQNYKLTPAPSENCFAIFLLRVRSNNRLIDTILPIYMIKISPKVWVVKNGTVFNDVWTPCYWLQKQFYQWVCSLNTQLLYWLGHSSHLAKSYFDCFSISMDWLTKPL
jgi:hypothetical protein